MFFDFLFFELSNFTVREQWFVTNGLTWPKYTNMIVILRPRRKLMVRNSFAAYHPVILPSPEPSY